MPPERSVDIDRQVDYAVARHYAEIAAQTHPIIAGRLAT